jgi:hypothetical protein
LAVSIQRTTTFSDGNARTSLSRLFTSAIRLARLAGLRYFSSLTVSTPAASSNSAYSSPIPLIRILSAKLATRSRHCGLKPVRSASDLRPLGSFAASRSLVVVRMPNDLSLVAIPG